jgi:hypothetical protein
MFLEMVEAAERRACTYAGLVQLMSSTSPRRRVPRSVALAHQIVHAIGGTQFDLDRRVLLEKLR